MQCTNAMEANNLNNHQVGKLGESLGDEIGSRTKQLKIQFLTKIGNFDP